MELGMGSLLRRRVGHHRARGVGGRGGGVTAAGPLGHRRPLEGPRPPHP